LLLLDKDSRLLLLLRPHGSIAKKTASIEKTTAEPSSPKEHRSKIRMINENTSRDKTGEEGVKVPHQIMSTEEANQTNFEIGYMYMYEHSLLHNNNNNNNIHAHTQTSKVNRYDWPAECKRKSQREIITWKWHAYYLL
jgi:hypothetical protein